MLSGFNSYSQQITYEGYIKDTASQKPLQNVTVCLLRQKDSVLSRFVRTDLKGKFSFNNLAAGDYILQAYYPTYADFTDKVTIGTLNNTTLITMCPKTVLLKDITILSKLAAIRMKGDTLEFKADSFKLQEGAAVEDLLKRLPGIQVDKDGKITAMGETVQKVLVDGEEFFGNDPTIATKNIQADAVDKVQVFDKKSDQATFTGIDDGVKNKTINLKLKDDKKRGYFGKLETGGGNNDKWNNSLMLNHFKGRTKISGYGIMSSTGKTGLNWEENGQYGEGEQLEYNEDNGYYYTSNEQDDMGGSNYYGEGLPKNWAAGLNFSRKWNDDKKNFNGSYLYKRLTTEGNGNTFSKFIIDTSSTLYTNESRTSTNIKSRNSINGTYDWQIDSSTSIKVTARGYKGTNEGTNNYSKSTTNQLNEQINESKRNNSFNGNSDNLKTSFLIKKKFRKQGRTISFNLDYSLNDMTNNNYLYEHDTYYSTGIATDSITDQLKKTDNNTQIITGRLVYTEPIIKKVFLELNYSLNSNKNNADVESLDKTAGGFYDKVNSTFSNHYQYDVLTNSGGASFKYNGKKAIFYIGSNIANSNFTQQDLLTSNVQERRYYNFYPRTGFNYKFSQFNGLNISYNGQSRQPTIAQIQPLRNNNDQLTVMVGNPNLQQEFRHSVNFSYHSYKVLSERSIYAYGNVTSTDNAIVTNNATSVDSGKTTVQYTNVNGNYNSYTGMGFYCKLKKIDMRFGTSFNLNMSRYNSFVNNKKNTTDNVAPGADLWFRKEKEKKYNISYSLRYNYNITSSSLQPGLNNNYWTMEHNIDINIQLLWKLEFNQNIEISLREKTAMYDKNTNVVLWNAYLGKKFLKDDKGMIKISVNDLLNQNIGYSRFVNNSTITENNYQTIARYFQLSFIWNFSKAPGSK